MLIYNIEVSETASSGGWSVNTLAFSSVLLKQIILKATTATTTFKFRITDRKSNVIYDTDTSATGTLREDKLDIPMKDINTLEVHSSSKNEAFTGRIMIQEDF